MGGWAEAGMGAKIFSIATHPEHRRQGLGRLMTLEGVYCSIGFHTLDIWHVFRHPHLRSPSI
jgi:hypothetical protein